ncbi:MAG: tRNA (guanosine(46)-N7)-methyltransferase TrmB [Propionibacteriaceae bacterium]
MPSTRPAREVPDFVGPSFVRPSFVRRSARMTAGQQRAWEEHRENWVLDVPRAELDTAVALDAHLDLPAAYGRNAPLVVEIGPGVGDSLVAMAAARPEVDVLAIEVWEPAVARILGSLARDGVANVRLLAADAVPALTVLIAPGSVAELWVFFPDPWPKTRHHKRRLVDAAFADLAADRLQPGGLWRLATDWAPYAEQMRAALDDHADFVVLDVDELADLPPRPVTRFERRALVADRTVTDLAYRRR